jgi:hypothetical protein
LLAKAKLATMGRAASSTDSMVEVENLQQDTLDSTQVPTSPISVAHHLGLFSEPSQESHSCAKFEDMSNAVAESVVSSKWPMSLSQCSQEVLRPGLPLKRQTQLVRETFGHVATDRGDFGKVE